MCPHVMRKNYDKTALPSSESPLLVRLRPFLIDIKAVKDHQMSLMVEINMAIMWKDPRLLINSTKHMVTVSQDFGLEMWRPEINFHGTILQPVVKFGID